MKTFDNLKITPKSVREQAYEQIRELILNGSFPAGMRLDLVELCNTFGISKTPLTEALQKLTRDGLVTVKPRSGTFVSELDPADLEETFGFRLVIELGASEMILQHITDKQIHKLKAMNRSMQKILDKKPGNEELFEFLKLDASFHDLLITSSGNRLISDHYRQVNSLLLVMRMRDAYSMEQYQISVTDHEKIINSLINRDCTELKCSMKNHIMNAKLNLLEALSS
ncbi:GntR family transcriptional regulator [Marinobacterium rhizophilum]|uniref:GntR family transcriptional regulator n=1 Tax=Marinobacterium rhizophilum TaxID=420402 RepID=A0ABY5HIC2_9GAMM|nr:GntR family transcriptional regulator [Marinobacterium rhizophilum]UTW12008.1 GntR family transcriptional regulator [Marinobacterium rhizophilum]